MVLKIINDTETRSNNIETVSKQNEIQAILVLYRNPKGGRRPKAVAPPSGGGQIPSARTMVAFISLFSNYFQYYSTSVVRRCPKRRKYSKYETSFNQ